MKRKLLLTAVFSWSFFLTYSQVIKMYCFKQEVNGGARSEIPNANTMTVPARYFIVVETKKKKVQFSKITINRIPCSFTCEAVQHLPLVLQTSNGGASVNKDTLLRSSAYNVFLLKNLAPVNDNRTPSKSTRNNIKDAIALTYRYNHRTRCISCTKTKTISPLFTQ
ncbi:MAG: hypothetical protein JST86_08155 [Bacteroidetes bacterium]|nr:hypothetical protein [Bacteroidota bacterium]